MSGTIVRERDWPNDYQFTVEGDLQKRTRSSRIVLRGHVIGGVLVCHDTCSEHLSFFK